MRQTTKPAVKIYGERNTGTRYLHQLIRLNLDVRIIPGVEDEWIWSYLGGKNGRWIYEFAADLFFFFNASRTLGWKHVLVPPVEVLDRMCADRQPIVFVTIIKNPYSWLLSMYKRPYHCRTVCRSFEEFLVTPWQTRWREKAPKYFANPVDMWNRKNGAYLELHRQRRSLCLRYEDLLASPEEWIERIAGLLQVPRKREVFLNREKTTKANSGQSYAFYRDFYLQEKWKAELSVRHIDIINESLDRGMASSFGYPVLTDKEAGLAVTSE
jgi:hypothetical protein